MICIGELSSEAVFEVAWIAIDMKAWLESRVIEDGFPIADSILRGQR